MTSVLTRARSVAARLDGALLRVFAGGTRVRANSVVRLTAAMLLLGLTVALIVFQKEYRHLEAVLAAHLFSNGGVQTYAIPDTGTVMFRLANQKVFGLEISPECSSAFLIAPFTALGAAMLWRRRLHPGRVGLGVALAALLLVLCNQLRVGMIATLIDNFGLQDGYKWGHLVLGSLLSILFIAGSLALLLWIVVSGRSDTALAEA